MRRFELNCRGISDGLGAALSEHDILTLQELFLSPGLNYLQVSSVMHGRALIRPMLSLLSKYYFSPVACLTTASVKLDSHIVSLHDEMAFFGALAFSHTRLDSYLLEQFDYDFLWVECFPELTQAPWFDYFKQRLLDFNLAAQLPIVFVEFK